MEATVAPGPGRVDGGSKPEEVASHLNRAEFRITGVMNVALGDIQ